MKPGSIRAWLGPTLGAVLLVIGAAGLAYKVISGYRHPAPEVFLSVQDQNKLPAASVADRPVDTPTFSPDVAAPSQSAASTAPSAPITAAPPVVAGDALENASSAAAIVDLPAEAQDNAACAAIKTEQHEIEAALKKQHSPEEGRYLLRRLHELAEQSVKHECAG